MDNCTLCGEYTFVRKSVRFICELCDKAKKIEEERRNKFAEEYCKKTEEKYQSKWIKERERLLK